MSFKEENDSDREIFHRQYLDLEHKSAAFKNNFGSPF